MAKITKNKVDKSIDNVKKADAPEEQHVKEQHTKPAKVIGKNDKKKNHNSNINIDKIKLSGMVLRSHTKFLESQNGMQLRSYIPIEFKHLN